jgi:hypothetical protein
MTFDKNYWHTKWENQETGWDIGYISTPLKEYIDQLKNKNIRILIPGSGSSYEGEYLFKKGFKNVFLLDYSELPFINFLKRCPDFPKSNLINQNFFEHEGSYDLILEQTFFSAIHPKEREQYVQKMAELLADNGRLAGLLFAIKLGDDFPPFGGNKEEYTHLFSPYFNIKNLEIAHNSIGPRQGNEFFINLVKKEP